MELELDFELELILDFDLDLELEEDKKEGDKEEEELKKCIECSVACDQCLTLKVGKPSTSYILWRKFSYIP